MVRSATRLCSSVSRWRSELYAGEAARARIDRAATRSSKAITWISVLRRLIGSDRATRGRSLPVSQQAIAKASSAPRARVSRRWLRRPFAIVRASQILRLTARAQGICDRARRLSLAKGSRFNVKLYPRDAQVGSRPIVPARPHGSRELASLRRCCHARGQTRGRVGWRECRSCHDCEYNHSLNVVLSDNKNRSAPSAVLRMTKRATATSWSGDSRKSCVSSRHAKRLVAKPRDSGIPQYGTIPSCAVTSSRRSMNLQCTRRHPQTRCLRTSSLACLSC